MKRAGASVRPARRVMGRLVLHFFTVVVLFSDIGMYYSLSEAGMAIGEKDERGAPRANPLLKGPHRAPSSSPIGARRPDLRSAPVSSRRHAALSSSCFGLSTAARAQPRACVVCACVVHVEWRRLPRCARARARVPSRVCLVHGRWHSERAADRRNGGDADSMRRCRADTDTAARTAGERTDERRDSAHVCRIIGTHNGPAPPRPRPYGHGPLGPFHISFGLPRNGHVALVEGGKGHVGQRATARAAEPAPRALGPGGRKETGAKPMPVSGPATGLPPGGRGGAGGGLATATCSRAARSAVPQGLFRGTVRAQQRAGGAAPACAQAPPRSGHGGGASARLPECTIVSADPRRNARAAPRRGRGFRVI